jgi:hypothetical protein
MMGRKLVEPQNDLRRRTVQTTQRLKSILEKVGFINEATIQQRLGQKYGMPRAEPQRINSLRDLTEVTGI